MTTVIAHYSELALKGHNRSWFIRRLVRNLHLALSGPGVQRVRSLMGRIEIVLASRRRMKWSSSGSVESSASPTSRWPIALPLDFDAMAATIVDGLPRDDVAGFRVRARRADKTFPLTSPALEAELGARIVDARGWRVDLHHPALTVGVEIVPGEAFYHLGKTKARAAFLPAPPAGSWRCSRAASIRQWRRGD